MNYTCELKELESIPILSIHHQGDLHKIPDTIGKLVQWAIPKGLMENPERKLVTTYLLSEKGMSTEIGLTASPEIEGESEIAKGILPGGLHLIGHFEIEVGKIPAAWSLLYTLTSKNQCKPRAGKTFEIYVANPGQHPEGKCHIDLCLPVDRIDTKLMEKKAISLVSECEIAILASISGNGNPRPVPMSKIKTEGLSCFWFSTGTYSDKTLEFNANPKAGVCFTHGGDSVIFTGNVEIVNDMKEKVALWSDWMYAHFPQGVADPNYCILKFSTEDVTYWINNEFLKTKI